MRGAAGCRSFVGETDGVEGAGFEGNSERDLLRHDASKRLAAFEDLPSAIGPHNHNRMHRQALSRYTHTHTHTHTPHSPHAPSHTIPPTPSHSNTQSQKKGCSQSLVAYNGCVGGVGGDRCAVRRPQSVHAHRTDRHRAADADVDGDAEDGAGAGDGAGGDGARPTQPCQPVAVRKPWCMSVKRNRFTWPHTPSTGQVCEYGEAANTIKNPHCKHSTAFAPHGKSWVT